MRSHCRRAGYRLHKKGTISICRPNYLTNDQGQLEVEVAETPSAQVYTLLALNAMLHANKSSDDLSRSGCDCCPWEFYMENR